jgi:hypothetical protein
MLPWVHPKSKTSHLDHIESHIMQNYEQKKKVKKSEKPRFYGQNKHLSLAPCP